jgi:hypothetical protein
MMALTPRECDKIEAGPQASDEELFEPKVAGFLGFNNLAKAEARVKQLGGLTLQLAAEPRSR